MGIRPEHFEDATLVGDRPDGHTFKATVDVSSRSAPSTTRTLRSRPGPCPPSASEAVPHDHGSASGRRLRDGLPMVARLGRGSRVRQGDEAELWFDATQIQLFDDCSGQNLLAAERRATALAPPPGTRALTRGPGGAPAPDTVASGVD